MRRGAVLALLLAASMSDVPPPALDLYEALTTASASGRLDEQFTKNDIQKALGRDWGESRVYRTLGELVRHEFVLVVEKNKGPKPNIYKLGDDKPDVGVGALPDVPELVRRAMRRGDFWKSRVA